MLVPSEVIVRSRLASPPDGCAHDTKQPCPQSQQRARLGNAGYHNIVEVSDAGCLEAYRARSLHTFTGANRALAKVCVQTITDFESRPIVDVGGLVVGRRQIKIGRAGRRILDVAGSVA